MTARNAAYMNAKACPVAEPACAVYTASSEGEDAHLDEDETSGTAILVAVQLQVDGTVDPRDPDQAKHDEELDHAAQRDLLGEMACRLRDDHDVDEVVEKLEERDATVQKHVAVKARGTPEPALETPDCLAAHSWSVMAVYVAVSIPASRA